MRVKCGGLEIWGVLLLVLGGSAAWGRVVYVDDDAPLGGDGTSWATAFKYLHDGLAASSAGDEVRVGQGVYKPDRSEMSASDWELRVRSYGSLFVPGSGTIIKGGYVGWYGPWDPNVRDTGRFRTILSADLLGDDAELSDASLLEKEPSRADNARGILLIDFSLGQDHIVLDGLDICGSQGAHALVGISRSLIVRDCRFYENFVEGPETVGGGQCAFFPGVRTPEIRQLSGATSI